ncbi:spidroin-2-like isoform X2 [Gadus macrocephalus]|uniref:spidroin-2-like isoform X2 n=1 Tax=Gadus macrocephalus TaxID=80720 RepID=UPI0028CBA4C1|nr:spidroin-2-like isoform X2 [Gadus macrocephalus]
MKHLLLMTLAAAICNVDAGSKKLMRMMAMNGMMNGANPAMMGGGGFAPGMMGGGGFAPGMVGVGGFAPGMMGGGGFAPGMMGGGGFAPGMMGGGGFAPGMMGGGGFAPGMMGGAGAGFAGQPVAQFVQGAPAYAYQPLALPPSPVGVSNVFPVPAANTVPYMGVPQMAGFNPLQQQGVPAGGALPQRFKRQIMKQRNTAMETQIQTPPEMQTTAIPCDVHKENN